jgi:hypothetical protein
MCPYPHDSFCAQVVHAPRLASESKLIRNRSGGGCRQNRTPDFAAGLLTQSNADSFDSWIFVEQMHQGPATVPAPRRITRVTDLLAASTPSW